MIKLPILRKLLYMTSILCGVIVLFSFIGFRLGYDGLILLGDIKLHYFAQFIIILTLWYSQWVLLGGAIIDNYTKKILLISLPTAIMPIVFCALPDWIVSLVIPPLYFLIIAKFKKYALLNVFKRYSFYLLYQIPTLFTRTGKFVLGYNQLTLYQYIVMSLDLLIVCTIIFAFGGEKHYVGVANKQHSLERRIFPDDPEQNGYTETDSVTIEVNKAFSKLKGWKTLVAMSIEIGIITVQFIIISFVAKLGNVWIEGTIISASYLFFGLIFKKRWHAKSCTTASVIIFYTFAKAIPRYGYTQLFPVITSLCVIYCMYRIAVYTDKAKANELLIADLQNIKPKRFCCKTATENEIRSRCIEFGKKEDYINFMILAYRSGLTRKEIAEKLHITEATVKKYKHDRTKELEQE